MTDQKTPSEYEVERDEKIKGDYDNLGPSEREWSRLVAIRYSDWANARMEKVIEEKDQHIREAAGAYADDLVERENVIEKLRKRIEKAKWMDSAVRVVVLEKQLADRDAMIERLQKFLEHWQKYKPNEQVQLALEDLAKWKKTK